VGRGLACPQRHRFGGIVDSSAQGDQPVPGADLGGDGSQQIAEGIPSAPKAEETIVAAGDNCIHDLPTKPELFPPFRLHRAGS